MANTLVKKLRESNGFTLVELMVVMLILSIVSTIAIIAVTSAFKSSTITACKADWRSVESAIAGFTSDNPSGWPVSNALYPTAGVMPTGSLADLNYISKLTPVKEYSIVLTGDRSTYAIEVHKNDSNGAPINPALGSTVDDCSNL